MRALLKNWRGGLVVVVLLLLVASACGSARADNSTPATPADCVDINAQLERATAAYKAAVVANKPGGKAKQEREALKASVDELTAMKTKCESAASTSTTGSATTAGAGSTTQASSTTSTASSTTVAPEPGEPVDQATGLPIVTGGSTAAPLVGNQDQQAPVASPVKDWADVVTLMGKEMPWYSDCTTARVGVSLDAAKFYAALLPMYDLRYIMVSGGASVTDQQARDALAAQGYLNTGALQVLRVPEFRNTRHSHVGGDDRCAPFIDRRPQVRVIVAIPVFDNAGKFLGLNGDKGLLGQCGNPWDMVPPVPQQPPSTGSSVPPGTKPPTKPPKPTSPPSTGRKGNTGTTVAPHPAVTNPPVVVLVPPTAPPDTLPPGRSTSTIVPTVPDHPVQDPHQPPTNSTAPSTSAPPAPPPAGWG